MSDISLPTHHRPSLAARIWRRLLKTASWTYYGDVTKRTWLEEVEGVSLVVLPNVLNPRLFRSGQLLAQYLRRVGIGSGSTVLDMGTGSGVCALAVGQCARRVIAVDIVADAVRCARINVLLNRLEDVVEVRHGDLFDPVDGERFDVVLLNPPFFCGAATTPFQYAWQSDDLIERFARGLSRHLSPNGYAVVLYSSLGNQGRFFDAFSQHNLRVTTMETRTSIGERLTIYRIAPAKNAETVSL